MHTNTNMSEKRITDILNQREPFSREMQAKQYNLRQQLHALRALEGQYRKIERQGPQGMFSLIQHLPLPQLIRKMEALERELDKPVRRFARQTLNIGVVGRAGQGKSTLLQKLSGVGSEVIPAGNRGFCTGVRSVIQHNADLAQKGGLISFYTREEFLRDVLAPYYQRLSLGDEPRALESFIAQPLPRSLKKDALSRAMYQHLEEYKQRAPIYEKLLGSADLPVPIQNVRRYVAQDSLDGSQRYYEFMAVKEAIITTDFHQKDVAKIALVDMPGLGDTGVGDDTRLMRGLGEEVDVVIFVLMPHMRAELQDVDFQLYDLAHDAMGGIIPIEDWSFMVLNHKTTPGDDNGVRCEDIKGKIESGVSGHGDHPIKVVQCIVADCSNEAAAGSQVLMPVLEYLAHEMRALDEKYIAGWRLKLCTLDQEIEQLLEQMSSILDERAAEHKEDQAFEECFGALWPQLTTASFNLVEQLKQENTNPNEQFVLHLREIITACRQDQGLPTIDEIPQRVGAYGAPINAFNDYLHHMRTHLTRHFINIDEYTNFTMDEVKTKIAHLFLSAGRLDYLFSRLGEEKELLAVMATQPLLAEALRGTFRMLGNYQLSLRGVFLHRIREADTLADISPFYGTRVPPRDFSPQSMLQTLDMLQKAAVDKIEQRLSNFISIPGSAACALGEEFIDQTLRSQNAKRDWRLFYKAHRATIWPEVFEQSIAWSELQHTWQMACQTAKSVHLAAPICTLNQI
ncbi:MAG TPA: dynamin family protein [Ktedonobacteraceae bacterium]|nr:dynamin family protein [Ktedonobacteraceae bacterium]